MGITQFPNKRFVRVFETDEVLRMGSFVLAKKGQLGHIKILMFINSVMAGTERVRLKVYSHSDHGAGSLIATSSWRSLSKVEDAYDLTSLVGWYGWLLIDFNRENLDINTTYYLTCEIDDYVRNANVFYIGLVHDHLSPIYGTAQTQFYNNPLGFILFNYEERS